jgi:signal transduction histidine kinase
VNISDLLQRVYSRFIDKAKVKGILLGLPSITGDNDVTAVTDGNMVIQVLENLVDNAVKFTIEGNIDFGYVTKEDKVEFFVSDTGPGIPEEKHNKVFKRFYQADSSASRTTAGMGLGLPIAAAYVHMLGGDIWYNSIPGKGTEFRFWIPADKASK